MKKSKAQSRPGELVYTAEERKHFALQIAELRLNGESVASVVKKLPISVTTVKAIMEEKVYKDVFDELYENRLGQAKSAMKFGIAERTKKFIDLLDRLIKKDNVKALELGMRTLGVLQSEEEGDKQAQSLTVILPKGLDQPKDITHKVKIEDADA